MMSKTAAGKDDNPHALEVWDDGTDAEWNELRQIYGPHIVCWPDIIQTLLDDMRAEKAKNGLAVSDNSDQKQKQGLEN
jgi:hypothetical protein